VRLHAQAFSVVGQRMHAQAERALRRALTYAHTGEMMRLSLLSLSLSRSLSPRFLSHTLSPSLSLSL
jgi:hypothetical protein